MLANADLDELDSDEEDYQRYKAENARQNDVDDYDGSEGDASKYLEQMIEMYKDKSGDETGRSSNQPRKARPPPAVM